MVKQAVIGFCIFVLFCLLVSAAEVAPANGHSYKVYCPNRVLVPKYEVVKRADGTLAVYESGKPLIPIWIIKPNRYGSGYNVYKPDQVEKAVAAATKSIARQLDSVSKLMAAFYSSKESRKSGVPVRFSDSSCTLRERGI